LIPNKYDLDDGEDWSYPRWVNAPRVGFGDKFEVFVFRFITWIPVIITFSIFAFLFGFYLFCYLHPCLIGDMQGTLGIPDYWSSNSDKENDRYWA